ncbi:Siderophore-interacting protein [Microbacterium esteraromaticum]|uniref:Siderophore-interacting protein n=1 Tax=Microbacterium esteraromaticum TaxID=57043 RepID=A0A1R4IL95_9MICO|nr:siderophore-interacting protein [Microbacterium esteraromaticum]SJN20617.1 Siderophore-interacting protein [Microbacterium esteraromaticum]
MSHHAYRTFRTTVARLTPLSPNFTRVTLTGEELQHFGTDGLDQRIKLMFPFRDGSVTDVGQFDETQNQSEWYRRWRELPDELRNPIRTYTIRAPRPWDREIDVDFVLHGTDGPASAWATDAQVGDPLCVVGPDARSEQRGSGIEWRPGSAISVLIAGDETAVPAICSIVESLDDHVTGEVCIEVPVAADALPLRAPSGVRVTWLPRNGAVHGMRLSAAVHAWGRERAASAVESAAASAGADDTTTAELPDVTDDEVLWEVPEAAPTALATEQKTEYAWLAGEAGTITALRRHLVRNLGIDRRSIAFMGYWRAGRAEAS